MTDYTFLFLNLLLLFLFFVVLRLLAKVKLLPLYLYLTAAEFIGPVLKADHRVAYYGIMVLLILHPIIYWGLRLYQRKQEKKAELEVFLARAYGKESYFSEEHRK